MSQSKAISAYSNRNPVLKLFTHVIPGSRQFAPTVWRLVALSACIAAIGGAYHLAGGDIRSLWQPQPFFAVLTLTFVLSTMKIGFRHSTVGFGAFLLGAPDKADRPWTEFSENIRGWALQGAHFFALMMVFTQIGSIRDVGGLATALTPAVLGYIYAVLFGMILPARANGEKVQFSDAMMPGVFLICGYYLMRYLML